MSQHTSKDFSDYNYRFRVVEVPDASPYGSRVYILAYNGVSSFIIADKIHTRRDADWICECLNTSVEAAYWQRSTGT